jgi:Tfp pilus assembly protein PilO
MTWISRPDRLWAIGGTVVAVVLLLLAWTFLIGPQRERTDELSAGTEDVLVSLTTEQRRLNQLTKENETIETYEADLAARRAALPHEAALAAFLRELQAAGDAAGVAVTSLNAGSPSQAKTGGGQIFSITVTIDAVGPLEKLAAFLNQLQQVQPRAALIVSTNLAPGGEADTLSDDVKLSISAQIFVAAPAAAEAEPAASAPAATTD